MPAKASAQTLHISGFARILDQMRRQRPQRPQLPADQRQLRLHQPLPFIDFIRHLLKPIGQGFFLITLNRNRLFARQALGYFVEAGSQVHTGAVDQMLAHV